jgi:hypothetical protein
MYRRSIHLRALILASASALLAGSVRAASEPPPAGGGARDAAASSSADLRPLFAGWELPPRLQGGRNTCSVFVVTGCIEFALAKKLGKCERLSVEFLNWSANQAAKEDDDGSFFSELWKGFQATGVCPEKSFPYRPEFKPKLAPPDDAVRSAKAVLKEGLRYHWIKEWNPSKGLSDEQLAEVRRVIARGWPVCGGFLWPKKEAWDDDVLRICPRDHVRDGHSVLLVGYRDDPALPGGGLVIVRNSSRGGKDGYLTYEYLKTYMNDAAWIDFEGAGGAPAAAAAPAGPGTAGGKGAAPPAPAATPAGR